MPATASMPPLAKASEAEAVLAEVLNELGRSPVAPIPLPKPAPQPVPAETGIPASTPPRTGKGWGCLGWSIFGVIMLLALVIVAFTVRF